MYFRAAMSHMPANIRTSEKPCGEASNHTWRAKEKGPDGELGPKAVATTTGQYDKINLLLQDKARLNMLYLTMEQCVHVGLSRLLRAYGFTDL